MSDRIAGEAEQVSDPTSPHHEQPPRLRNAGPELLCVAGTDGHVRSLNPGWEEVLGWSEAELQTEPLVSFLHPDDAEAVPDLAALARQAHDGPVVSRFRHKDGTYRWLQWAATADESGTIFAAAHDVTDDQAATTEARQSEELWQSVLATAADPIVVIDETGVIQLVNPATSALFGYDEAELVGHNVGMLMPEPYRGQHEGFIQRYVDTGEARIIGIGREVEARRADGTTFPIALAVSEVRTAGRRLFTGIIHDLTARHAVQEELRRANDRLEARVEERTAELERSMSELARSNRDLEQFAYIASHDLQAPLRNVRQGLELLDDHLEATTGRGLDDEAQELRCLVAEAVTHMEDLVRGLLSYSRVERNTRPVTSVDLDHVTEDILHQLQLDLEEADVTVTTDGLPTVPGDEIQLRQLLQNLIENAVKYRATHRRPEIRLSAARTNEGWVITVADNGVGVNEEQHDRIFELFRRGHPDYEGVGLGLAICQRIVERHGGTIWVESEPDRGAKFIFTLPGGDPGA